MQASVAVVWHNVCQDLLIVLVMHHVKQMGQNGGNSTVHVYLTQLCISIEEKKSVREAEQKIPPYWC